MIIVIMREEDDIDFWEVFEWYSRILVAFWTNPRPRTRSIIPNWICENIHPMCLDQVGCVSDIGNTETFIIGSRWYYGSNIPFLPSFFISVKEPIDEPTFAFSSPFDLQRLARRPPNIIKMFSIKMIRFFSTEFFARIKMIRHQNRETKEYSTIENWKDESDKCVHEGKKIDRESGTNLGRSINKNIFSARWLTWQI